VFSLRPKVTLGICVRNCESTINDAIESIAKQDYPHSRMELIFVDESDDKTPVIIEECISTIDISARLIRCLGKGLGKSRNLVIENASGEFVLWVDGDMVLSSDFVRRQVDFMQSHPKIGIARGRQVLEPAKNLLATLETYSRAAGRMVDYRSEKTRYKALGTGGAISRVKALKKIGGFDESLVSYCEDWDLEIRVRNAGWALTMTDAAYRDYERNGLTWESLFSRYWRRGYYTHYFLHKNGPLIRHYRMFPPAAFMAGLFNALRIFKITGQKGVFMMPLEHLFKMTAWYLGYIDSHIMSYQPAT
jgi:glycosyltransferase involved in cell wall biosynthesis